MPTETWERRGEQRREAVLAAAEAEFSSRGFSGGSLNTIVREAGISKGSLFQYFEDKGDLYAYLAERASVRIRAEMQAHMESLSWRQDFFASLRSLLEFWIDYFDQHPGDRAMTAAVNLEHEDATITAVRAAVNHHYVEVLKPLLVEASEAGQLARDADLDAFLALLILLMPHLAIAGHYSGLDPVLGIHGASGPERREIVARLTAVLAAAFGAE